MVLTEQSVRLVLLAQLVQRAQLDRKAILVPQVLKGQLELLVHKVLKEM